MTTTLGHGLLAAACAVAGGLAGAMVPNWVARLPEPALAEDEVKPPYVELARRPWLRVVAVAAVAACCTGLAWLLGWHPALPALMYVVFAGVTLTYVDVHVHLLPNAIVLPSYPVVIALLACGALGSGEWGAFARALGSGAALWLLFAAIVLIYPAGMGFGDVKLVGLLGLVVGWFGMAELVLAVMLSFGLAGLVALGLVLARRASRKSPIPFGPFLIAGFLLAAVTGEPLIAWYLGRYS